MTNKFHADQFTPTEFHSAADKAKFANQFVRFVESGFDYAKFPHWFYVELSNCFGFIAHYNKDGFYSTYFDSLKGKNKFLDLVENYPCWGDVEYTYSDVERDLIAWLKASNIRQQYIDQQAQQKRNQEISMLYELIRRYPSEAKLGVNEFVVSGE